MEPLSANDPRTVGEFALRARLGSGGMGRVYLGFSPGGRAVAIKVVHPELARDPEFLQRFGREVASARAVSGVYTAPVVASGLDDDPPWMATAFVPGPPLAEVVIRRGPLPEAAVWRLAAGLSEALDAVHACNLVHRDLKPSNVLLAPDGPHVIDFGISRAFEGTALTSAGMVVGTPGYMSPEQAEGQQAGPPSDVFSLGCVLAYAATGTAPFGAGSAASVLYRVVTAEPDLRLVPERLRQVIAACLSKRAADRVGLAQLTAMISALGPATPLGLGSFWPEPVASFVAGDQAFPTPTQVGPGAGPAGLGLAGAAPLGAPPPVPTATSSLGGSSAGLGQPDVIQTGMREPVTAQPDPPWAGAAAQTPPPPPAAGGTGHAPMVVDGYYAAAIRDPQQAAGPSWPPQYPGGQQPSWPPPGGSGPVTGAPGTQAPGTQYAGGPPPAAAWPPSGPQPASWPQPPPAGTTPWPAAGGAGAPGGASAPGLPGPLAQYKPGHRRPSTSEVPPGVRYSIRLMYLGAAATLLYVLFGASAAHRDDLAGATRMAGDLTLTAVWGGVAGIVGWIIVATSCRRGHGWTRVAATILLALHTVGALTVLLEVRGAPLVKTDTIVVWVIGLAAVILLWSHDSYAFFAGTRKH